MAQMTKFQRAAQLWSLLVFAARNQQILSYKLVEQLTGIFAPGVGGCLGPIQSYCKHQKLPPLTAIVINEDQGLPGEGFTGADLKDISQHKHRCLCSIGLVRKLRHRKSWKNITLLNLLTLWRH